MLPKIGDRVIFADQHSQRVSRVHPELDDTIVWLEQQTEQDPAWVYLYELTWLGNQNAWYHAN